MTCLLDSHLDLFPIPVWADGYYSIFMLCVMPSGMFSSHQANVLHVGRLTIHLYIKPGTLTMTYNITISDQVNNQRKKKKKTI